MKTKDDRRKMFLLLIHAGNLQGISDVNYDINKDMVNNNINNLNNIDNQKDSVSLKKCISHTNNINKQDNKNKDLKNNQFPSNEELNDFNYQKEINIGLIKEKEDLEEFYKNIITKLNEDYTLNNQNLYSNNQLLVNLTRYKNSDKLHFLMLILLLGFPLYQQYLLLSKFYVIFPK